MVVFSRRMTQHLSQFSAENLLTHIVTTLPREITPFSRTTYHIQITPAESITVYADLHTGHRYAVEMDYHHGFYLSPVRPRLTITIDSIFSGRDIRWKELTRRMDEWFQSHTPEVPDFRFSPWVLACIRSAVSFFVGMQVAARVRSWTYRLLEHLVREQEQSFIATLNGPAATHKYIRSRVRQRRRKLKEQYKQELSAFDSFEVSMDRYRLQLGLMPTRKSLHALDYELFLYDKTRDLWRAFAKSRAGSGSVTANRVVAPDTSVVGEES